MIGLMRRRAMGKVILPYDAEVEFLEGTGTQWIDTGIVPTLNKTIRCQFEVLYRNVQTRQIMGRQGSVYFGAVNGKLQIISSSTTTTDITLQTDEWYAGDVSFPIPNAANKSMTATYTWGESTGTSTNNYANTPSNGTFWLFCCNNADTLRGSNALKYFKLWQGGELVRDFIPVRKDGVGYMYDKVSRTLFGNAGTGSFVVGPDKVPQSYIQDGLIFHLDGINIGNNEGFWTDLVDGVKFNIPAGVTHEDDHFVFAKSHGMMQADTLVDWDAKTCHLEICLSGWTGANQMFIFDSRNNLGIALGSIKADVLIFGHGQGSYGRNRDFKCTSMLSTISVNNTLAYQNASACELVSNTYWGGGGSGITIGSRGSAMVYTGTIYSVRVYNRHLTEAEVLANYAVDAERFNIT